MDRFEYLALPESEYPDENVSVSVQFENGGFVPERRVALREFLTLLAANGPTMEFDEHPSRLVEIRIDFDRRRMRLKASRDESNQDA